MFVCVRVSLCVAGALDKSVSKGQFINDGLTENAKCRIRGAPNGADEYCLVYALNDYPIHEEMETCYEREYWLRKHQWTKLSEDGRPIQGRRFVQDYGP